MSFAKQMINHGLVNIAKMVPSRLMKHWLFLLRSKPELTDRWGYHIRPIHYYEPLPDFCQIQPQQITRRRDYSTINFNLAQQQELLRRLGGLYQSELASIADKSAPEGFDFCNPYFAGLDAALYYALIRDLKPKRIIEIGSGYSTRIAMKALAVNAAEGRAGKMTCIEPYPEPRLTEAALEIELVQMCVEDVGVEFFSQLSANDILFIDSSHAASFGSDVCFELLELLPRLNSGVWVHIHDIFFPHDYPAEWLIQKRIAFNEQYLLEAFLSFNQSYSVQAANYWLALEHSD
ncbi:MAG: class I SAM-dependent methyltransferase, partial [Chloroflexota bacterium]|nr:class I SAM-dependent methyltransferase [Chloroflexota bacterium]